MPEKYETEIHSALCVQWAKSRARVQGWTKDVSQLKDEMRRVIMTLEWKASWWATWEEADQREVSLELKEGLHAYALDQAELLHSLANSFDAKWEPLQHHDKGWDLPPIIIEKMAAIELVETEVTDEQGVAEELDNAGLNSRDEEDIYVSNAEDEDCHSEMDPRDNE